MTQSRLRRKATCLALVMGLAVGCGENKRPRTVDIHGRVTLAGGEWPKGGEVYFLPLEPAAGLPRRAAVAQFEPDGEFATPTSWVEGDGIVPGKYRVYVACWQTPPTRDGPPPVAYTDEKYISGATSDIEATIDEDSTDKEYHWDFPAEK